MKKSNFEEVSFFLDTGTYSKWPFTNYCYVDVTSLPCHIPAGQCSGTPSTRNSCFTFSSQETMPPNSPDLNLVDYPAWSLLEQRVYRTLIHDISHLKTRLVEEWQIINWAISQWRLRLRSCIQQEGGHFEHRRQNCSLTIDYLQC